MSGVSGGLREFDWLGFKRYNKDKDISCVLTQSTFLAADSVVAHSLALEVVKIELFARHEQGNVY